MICAAGTSPREVLDRVLERRTAIRVAPELSGAGLRCVLQARAAAFDVERWLLPAERDAPRAARLLTAVVRMALADARLPPDSVARMGAAIVIGTSSGGMEQLAQHLRDRSGPEALRGTYFAPSAFLAHALGARGPVETVSAACASGAIALALASDMVASGAAPMAIAAGYDVWCDFVHAGFDALGALSPFTPTPFRGDRAGLVLGDGAAAAVLTAGRGCRGTLLGAAMSGDARHITAPDREGLGVARAIRAALADANIGPEELDLVSAHGTGTTHNDAMETRGLKAALGTRAYELPIHTIKPIVGHTLGASGLLESIVALEALARGVAPPTLTSEVKDPDCDLDVTADGPRSLIRAEIALKVSSGFGGSNAALILGAPEREGA